MHAGDGLHQRAVAIFQPFAIQRFQAADIRGTVLRQFNILAGRDIARHAQRPHPLVANMTCGIAMNIAHKGEHMLDIAINRRNKFQQSFGKIGGNPFMSQR